MSTLGIINVFKPKSLTSTQVLSVFKKHFKKDNIKKIGHFGTLDPFATGVFLVGLGSATRLNQFIHDHLPKTYLAVAKLGIKTDTADLEGKVLATSTDKENTLKLVKIDPLELNQKLKNDFLGTYMQAPPAFSAAKFQGRALHEWARKDKVFIKKEKVERFIYDIELVRFKYPWLSFRVKASSGTYIRTLAEDIAQSLNTYACLYGLLRESIGEISYKNSLKRSDWNNPHVLDVSTVLSFEKVTLDEMQVVRYKNGAKVVHLLCDTMKSGSFVWMQNANGKILGLAKKCQNNQESFFLPGPVFYEAL